MRHGSLFSGIGGFDLAAEWMGWENVFHCEWNTFGQKVLKYYWPKSISYADITKTDFTIHRGNIDILTGGFPCQPYSSAGKRKGKEDERHLWPQMLRAIREIAPSWVVGENVYGLVNWSGGLVFHEVQTDLEAEGYEVFPLLLPAVSVNAPHRRDRIWFVAFNTKSKRDTKVGTICERQNNESFGICKINGFVAHTKNDGCGRKFEQWEGVQNDKWVNSQCEKERRDEIWAESKRCDESRITPNSNNKMLESGNGQGKTRQRTNKEKRIESFIKSGSWETFPTVSPICIGDDGISDRLDFITFPKWRNESIKAGGNAIVPQVVYQIFKSIEQYERSNGRTDNEGGND